MSRCNVLSGVLAGVAIGATLGILFAPKKGSKTRKQIAYNGKKCVDEVKAKYNNIVDEAVGKLDSLKQSADGLHAD